MQKEKYKTLHLVVKRFWYDMIESGEKTEEYRAENSYWAKRLLQPMGVEGFCKPYKEVCFHCGYTNKKTMSFEIKEITIDYGAPCWGAPICDPVFVIKLGQRIK